MPSSALSKRNAVVSNPVCAVRPAISNATITWIFGFSPAHDHDTVIAGITSGVELEPGFPSLGTVDPAVYVSVLSVDVQGLRKSSVAYQLVRKCHSALSCDNISRLPAFTPSPTLTSQPLQE